jgi:hypothetical protein
MRKLVIKLAGFLLALSVLTQCLAFAAGIRFSDVSPADWYYGDVMSLAASGAISGYTDGTFRPNNTITRAEFTKILVFALDLPTVRGNGFADTKDFWANEVISTAIGNGVIRKSEYGERFEPDKAISRLEIARMLVRALNIKAGGGASPFIDSSDVYVIAAYNEYLINGYGEGGKLYFREGNSATRAEAGAMLSRAVEYKADPEGYKAKKAVELGERDNRDSERALEESILSTSFDRKWFEADRKGFRQMLEENSCTVGSVYEEYIYLNRALYVIDSQAYKGAKGYFLYSPELSEKISILSLACYARKGLLNDMISGRRVKSFERYYPEFMYVFVGEDSSGITETKRFTLYDEKRISRALDSLPIPNYFLYGVNIYFVNGTHRDMSAFNDDYSTRGFYDTNIVVFNDAKSEKELLSTVYHEIGHSIGYEFFSKYSDDNYDYYEEDRQAMAEYAALYGKKIPRGSVEWEDDIDENFAEDFAHMIGGTEKLTSWVGDPAEFRAYYEKCMSRVDFSDVPLLERVVIRAGSLTAICLDEDFGRSSGPGLVVADPEVTIQVEGLVRAGERIGVVVSGNSYNGSFEYDSDGKCTFTLPKSGTYSVSIGPLIKNQRYGSSTDRIGKVTMYEFEISYIPVGTMRNIALTVHEVKPAPAQKLAEAA